MTALGIFYKIINHKSSIFNRQSSILNPKSKIQNPKSCLNRLLVQTLLIVSHEKKGAPVSGMRIPLFYMQHGPLQALGLIHGPVGSVKLFDQHGGRDVAHPPQTGYDGMGTRVQEGAIHSDDVIPACNFA